MVWTLALPLLAAAAAQQPLRLQPPRADLGVTPAALDLLQRDWVLMNWSLKYFDANHHVLLDEDEARAAAAAFRKLADTDRDGRVTPEEYRAARAVILAND